MVGPSAEPSKRKPLEHNPSVLLYRLVSAGALLAYSPYALVRSLAGRRRLGDVRGRLGRAAYPDLAGGIWIHAVSVGEVAAARNVIAAIRRRAAGTPIGLSSTTAAGLELARRVGGDAAFPYPLDLAGPVERSLEAVSPGLVLLTETEIWPLFLERAARKGVPVALVNGRVSSRSFRRYSRIRPWLRETLGRIAIFAMQTAEDAERIRSLGAEAARVRVTGNVKYDLPEPALFADAARLAELAAGRPVLVAGSTGEAEEEVVLRAWRHTAPRPLLVLAPRRPERFDEVAALAEGADTTVVRRSVADGASVSGGRDVVYVLDSMGELSSLYREARLAFVGGSLAPVGGHNPIEAWAAGVPTLVGPHTENFRQVTEDGEERGFLMRIRGERELASEITRALAEPDRLRALGERARQFVAENRGASDRTAELVLPLLRSEHRRALL